MRTKYICLALGVLGCLGGIGRVAKCEPQNTVTVHEDAHSFLDGVLKRYATAKTYHIELTDESQLNTDSSRLWLKRRMTAVLLPDKRFRFDVRFEMGRDEEISDGVSQWLYFSQIGEYTKQNSPAAVPGPVPLAPIPGINALLESRHLLGMVSAPRSWIRSATYLADEDIDVNGQPVLCTVVQAKGAEPGFWGVNRNIDTTYTFWIGKKDEEIWKEKEHREGAFNSDLPSVNYTQDRMLVFKVSEPDAQSAPSELFVFEPPERAELVEAFTTQKEKMVHQFLGAQLRPVKLGIQDGKTISLDSFRGKPVLLDFWATWCPPCRESLPAIEKLYSETADKGLVLLSIDDDEDARTATEFLAKQKDPWPNFHLTDEIANAFPEHGIPFFVLIDASGKVVYSHMALDESGLRAAVARLGPAFASVVTSPEPDVKP